MCYAIVCEGQSGAATVEDMQRGARKPRLSHRPCGQEAQQATGSVGEASGWSGDRK